MPECTVPAFASPLCGSNRPSVVALDVMKDYADNHHQSSRMVRHRGKQEVT